MILVTAAGAALFIAVHWLLPEQKPDEGALQTPPSASAISDFRTIDETFQSEIDACEVSVGISTIGAQIGTARGDLYASAQKGASVCRLVAKQIRGIAFPSSIDEARAQRLRAAMSDCARAMESNAFVQDKFAEFANSDARPKDVSDLKSAQSYGRGQSDKCYSGYKTLLSSLGFQIKGTQPVTNGRLSDNSIVSPPQARPLKGVGENESGNASLTPKALPHHSRPWFMIISPIDAYGNSMDAYTERQMAWKFATHASCMADAAQRAAAFSSVGLHGRYLCMYHNEPDAELNASEKVEF